MTPGHMTDERASDHPATDHLLEPTLSALSGSDVVLSGIKSDGTRFSSRTLTNVSFVPRGQAVFAIGMDPSVGGIRQFDLARVDRLESSGLVLDRQDVRDALNDALREVNRRSEGGSR